MSMSGDFEHRADECMRLAQRAGTLHDREFLIDMAMAWLGLADKPERPNAPQIPDTARAGQPLVSLN
jgi:hypothetical protein